MAKLYQAAKLIRSKNAGPFAITFDIIFPNHEQYEKVLTCGALTKENVADALNVPLDKITRYELPLANALKFSIVRKYPAGDFMDDDLYGCQEHRGLVNFEIPDDALL
jgi:hypothetical protein